MENADPYGARKKAPAVKLPSAMSISPDHWDTLHSQRFIGHLLHARIQSLFPPLAKSETLSNLAVFTVLICKIGEPLPQNGFMRITDITCEIWWPLIHGRHPINVTLSSSLFILTEIIVWNSERERKKTIAQWASTWVCGNMEFLIQQVYWG